jgi:lysophospholipid acyltransferase 7
LLFFRATEFFGIPKPLPHANAVQLILTLKSVGLAYEVHDSYKRKHKLKDLNKKLASGEVKEDEESKHMLEKLKLDDQFLSIEPSFFDIILYSYCYIGILTGPYFKFRTYYDWLNSKYSKDIAVQECLIARGKSLPIIIVVFFALTKTISFQDALKDEFYEYSLLYRLFYMSLIFTLFRMRFYIAWILAEFSCITSSKIYIFIYINHLFKLIIFFI